jgi:DNA-binding response OmpR family regulator
MALRLPARPVRVLIISTHEWTSRTLASVLAPYGVVVATAYNRAQAPAYIRDSRPDALIIDEQLPDGDGYALCSELRDEALISVSTPVFLAMPRPPTRRDRLAAFGAGCWACLGDPLDAEELVAMLKVFVPAKLHGDQARSRSPWVRNPRSSLP